MGKLTTIKMSPVTRSDTTIGNTYQGSNNIHALLTAVADKFTDSQYQMNPDINKLLDDYFVWEISYKDTPLGTFNTEIKTPNETDWKWTLYAKCRDEGTILKARYSLGHKKMLSVKKSTVEGAGLGCFSERIVEKDEIISTYLGERKKNRCFRNSRRQPIFSMFEC